jgi:putative sigma-54 modulation protein
MQISITGHHIDITQAIRAYIENKFARLERRFDNITNIHVILNVEKERQMAEATIHISRGKVFADAEHDDMLTSWIAR